MAYSKFCSIKLLRRPMPRKRYLKVLRVLPNI
jgi:hypothetical protein